MTTDIQPLLNPIAPSSWELIWSDEFDYEGLPDESKWSYEEGFVRNEELQYYMASRRENARVENGVLVIECRKEQVANKDFASESSNWKFNRAFAAYTSASLHTLHKGHWQYGRIEVRAKIPVGAGVWPAFWSMGANFPKVGWPACGEIDIMEYVGSDAEHVHGTVHYGDSPQRHLSCGGKLKAERLAEDFNVYAAEWCKNRIDFFFNDQKFHSFPISEAGDEDKNPFHQPNYLRLNLALGGWGGNVDESLLPQKYLVDYVRVYQRPGAGLKRN